MPKAKPFSEDDEKTTIESDQWGDEASTTIEQGEVADKMRALGFDAPAPPQRRAQIITGVTSTDGEGVDESTVDGESPPTPARLIITAGSDAGLEHSITSGKQYTIGRGLDNDIVLTDIAVSRKHFDLRNEAGTWVIVDRGSGNGTVVNGNLEDNPFMLANGDTIEIGNTTFRFDFQTTEVPRGQRANGFDSDDDEMSTVAGKPLNAKMLDSVDVEIETNNAPRVDLPPPSRSHARPKTLPPPVPLRPRSMSQPPAYPMTQPQGTPGPLPATTLPMPQMQMSRMPVQSSGPQSPTLLAAEPINLQNLMPTTIPGQGMPQQQMNPYAQYPQATEIPPHSVHAQMLVVAQQQRRGDLSTAHVQPIAYNALAVPPQRYSSAQPLSKRTKYIIVLGAATVFATIATIAIMRSGGSKTTPIANKDKGSAALPAPKPNVSPIVTPPAPKPQVAVTPPTPTPVTATPITPAPKPDPAPVVTKPDPKPDPTPKIAQKPADPTPKQTPKPTPKPTPRVQAQNDKDPVRTTPKQTPKSDPTPKPDPAPKRVATADANDRADGLYRDKKFLEASNVLAAAAKQASGDEQSTLKLKSNRLAGLAHVFNTGMAQGTKSTEAFDALVQASNYDQLLGGKFSDDITTRLAAVAPKAALTFVGSHQYDKAHTAVQKAEALGASDGNTAVVKRKLETEAKNLYDEAIGELDSNPSGAKEKLRQVKAMVDSKSPTFQKASSKLSGN